MPNGDGTGPSGQGPRTGRGIGLCNGYDMPGSANQGRGLGPCGRGLRLRQGNRFRQRVVPVIREPTKTEEKAFLKEEETLLKEELKEIEKRLKELKNA